MHFLHKETKIKAIGEHISYLSGNLHVSSLDLQKKFQSSLVHGIYAEQFLLCPHQPTTIPILHEDQIKLINFLNRANFVTCKYHMHWNMR
jgi:hypothetical protein